MAKKKTITTATAKIGSVTVLPRVLKPEEYQVRNLEWAVGVRCVCGYELDLFQYKIDIERKCKKCGRRYDIDLQVTEVMV